MFFSSILISISVFVGAAQQYDDIPTILNGKCNAKAYRDYYFQNKSWVNQHDEPTGEFPTNINDKDIILRDKIFANLGTNNPKIKSITPKSKIYPEGSIVEFDGEVLHRSGDMIILKWDNNPWG